MNPSIEQALPHVQTSNSWTSKRFDVRKRAKNDIIWRRVGSGQSGDSRSTQSFCWRPKSFSFFFSDRLRMISNPFRFCRARLHIYGKDTSDEANTLQCRRPHMMSSYAPPLANPILLVCFLLQSSGALLNPRENIRASLATAPSISGRAR